MKITEMVNLLTQAQASGVTEVEFYDAATHEGLTEAWMHYGSTTTPFAILFESEKHYPEYCQNTYTLEKGLKLTKR
jgi:hypothetical protein